jgi:hypothetical protein
MKKLCLIFLFSPIAFAQQTTTGRVPQINLYNGDPTGLACQPEKSIVQSTTTGSIYTCHLGTYVSGGGPPGPPGPPGAGNITASPQFSLFYQPNVGTQSLAQGDPNVTTDGSGNVTGISLKAKAIGGTNYATQYGSTTGITDCFVAGVNVCSADPTYAITEQPYNIYTKFIFPAATNAYFLDNRLGADVRVIRDPPRSNVIGGAGVTRASFFVRGCGLTAQQATIVGSGQSGGSSNCMDVNMWSAAPGLDVGAAGFGPSGWTTNTSVWVNQITNQRGISSAFTGTQYKAGIGDWANYFYGYGYGGWIAGADEGGNALALGGLESPNTYAGTIASGGGGAGATTLTITCTLDCNYPGQGRFIIDLAGAITGNITAQTAGSGSTPGTLTIDTAITPSTFWGTLHANVVTPTSTPLGTGRTAMTFQVDSGPGNVGSPAINDLVCFAGTFHEQAKITNVTGSGPWNVTVPLIHQHAINTWIMSGGMCGTFIDFTANDVAAGAFGSGTPAQKLRYPIEIIGAKDAHTLVPIFRQKSAVAATIPSGLVAYPVVNPAGTATNVGGIVTLSAIRSNNTVENFLFNQPTIYISGTGTAFDGPCFNSFQGPQIGGSLPALACFQSSSIGTGPVTLTGGAAVSIGSTGFGNTAVTLYPGAELLDNLDYSPTNCITRNGAGATAPCIDGVMTVEPNNAAWANADAVEQPHHPSAQFHAFKTNAVIYNPMAQQSVAGVYVGLLGNAPGAATGGNIGNAASDTGAFNLNYVPTPTGAIIGHAGTENPIGGLSLHGIVNYGLYSLYAPEPAGTSGIYFGCPFSGCTWSKAFSYFPLTMAGGTGSPTSSSIRYYPSNNVMEIGDSVNPIVWNGAMNGITMLDNLKFSTLAQPTLTITTATTGGSLADSTTFFYTIVAKNSAGAAITATEKTCTTGVSGASSNICNLDWTRVNGATIYQVCGRTTTGLEKLLQTITGSGASLAVDTNYFTDTGGYAEGASCTANSAVNGGVDLAGFVGIKDPASANEAKLEAPALSGAVTITLPSITGTVALASQLPLTGSTGTITGTALTATCDSGTASVTGAVVGAPVVVSSSTGADVGGAFYLRASVTSANTVTVYVCGTGTPASLAYIVRVIQ